MFVESGTLVLLRIWVMIGSCSGPYSRRIPKEDDKGLESSRISQSHRKEKSLCLGRPNKDVATRSYTQKEPRLGVGWGLQAPNKAKMGPNRV